MSALFIVTVVHFTEGNRIGTVFADTWEEAQSVKELALSTWPCDVHVSAIVSTTYTSRSVTSNGTRVRHVKRNAHLEEFVK